MRSPEEIKNAMRGCHSFGSCSECPYFSFQVTLSCKRQRNADALALIQQLEAERDVAVSELVGTCQVCRWEETEKCGSCHFNVEAWNAHESNWQWRGVQKEE